jgi:UDP:flavonoid glycosyltransferase YjiC (YdhE family)
MTSALFVTFEAGGNVPPALGLAQRLVAAGGRALVLGTPSQRAAVAAAGLEFEPFSAEQPYRTLVPVNLAANLTQVSRTVGSRDIAADVVRVARRESPDVVVVDCMLFRPLAASIRAGFRTVTLVHTLPSFFAGSFAKGPVGRVATARGLAPARIWAAADGTIATVLPGFDVGVPGPWADLQVVGPVTPAAPVGRGEAPAPAGRGEVPAPAGRREVPAPARARPRVLIALSTNWFPGQERTMRKLLAAVDGLDLDVVVTTGPSIDPATLPGPGNATLHQRADHERLLAGVDLLVGHGGHGTTMRALAHDVPVLIVPSFGFSDQPLVGQRVQDLGAGRVLPAGTSVAGLRAAISELAGPGAHRDGAGVLGARLRALDPAGGGVAYLSAGLPAASR